MALHPERAWRREAAGRARLAAVAEAPPQPDTSIRTLWFAAVLPQLPVEVFTRGLEPDFPFVVTEGGGTRRQVIGASRRAREAGIVPGMGFGTARARAHDLRERPRDPRAESAALQRLAGWAMRFSPHVCLDAPDTLLLEVGASLRLFGGWERLRSMILDGLGALGHAPAGAAAPTPMAARLLARAGGPDVFGRDALAGRLAEVALAQLDLAPGVHEALHALGLRRVGELLRLPRDGLSRRFGPELVRRLDRLLGRAADPRPLHVPPARFAATLPLPAESEDMRLLMMGAERLIEELAGTLQARQAGVMRLTLELRHAAAPHTRVAAGLVRPSREAGHLARLLGERLERTALPAPVREIRLAAGRFLPLAGEPAELFDDPVRRGADWQALVERLRARMGEESVRGVCLLSEHRPERAARAVEPGAGGGAESTTGARPLWLLPQPEAMEPREAGLRLLSGPERIDTGWWDGHAVARDYYVAEDRRGTRLWLYRRRDGDRGWWLHGVFG